MSTYNIPALLRTNFGLTGPIIVPGQRTQTQGEQPNIPAPTPAATAVAQSYLGTPVYERLQIVSGSTVLYTFPDTTVVQATLPIVIEKTAIQGRQKGGTVKEFISEDDYRVRIMTLVINSNSTVYPEEKVRELLNAVRTYQSVQIQGMYLNDLGISNLVFTNIDLKRERGEPGVMGVEIEALSDEPIELRIE